MYEETTMKNGKIEECKKKIKNMNLSESQRKELMRLCELKEPQIITNIVTHQSYSMILQGMIGGFVFVVALIFRELITETIFGILPELSGLWMNIIEVLIFMGLLFLFIYILLRVNRRKEQYEKIAEIRRVF